GYEATIGARMTARVEARTAAIQAGKTPRSRHPTPEIAKHGGDNLMKVRESNRKKLADTEKRDAGDV
ncbi:MAG: hypothetical protein ABIQ58_01905, partial [Candidatus Limnocylindrales bacterium]